MSWKDEADILKQHKNSEKTNVTYMIAFMHHLKTAGAGSPHLASNLEGPAATSKEVVWMNCAFHYHLLHGSWN
jgi:hypothetical protein